MEGGVKVEDNGELGEQTERAVHRLLRLGRYSSRAQVLRAGVKLVQEREAWLAELQMTMRRAIAECGADEPASCGGVADRLPLRPEPLAGRCWADRALHLPCRRRG